jgi:hypothetical protein
MTTPDLSVVLPCRDQEDHIADVLARYRDPLSAAGIAYELVVVPNACTDKTPDIVRALAAADPRLRCVEEPMGGWGRAVLRGLAAARGTDVCYTNSARTEPAHVVALYALYRRSLPCLAKVRRVNRGAPLREIGSWLYNTEGRLLFGFRAGDVNGTPKIAARALLQALPLRAQGDLLDLELMAQVTRRRLPIVEMEVEGFRRHGGRSSTGWKSAWRMYVGAVGLRKALGRTTVDA